MTAYYNEIEPFAADWLEELGRRGEISAGRVDRRSIHDVRADDVRDARRAHFFAGIGCWDYALRLAGWRDDLVIWTGSCPCQPFSQASPDAAGFADERHLWPEWFRLIAECRPAIVYGEQVASPAGLAWLDVVLSDLEGAGYTCAAADLCAASVGAPHRRQRLWFVAIRGNVADTERVGRGPRGARQPDRHGEARELADDDAASCRVVGREGLPDIALASQRHDADRRSAPLDTGVAQGDACVDRDREHARELPSDEREERTDSTHAPIDAGAARDPWRDCEWIWCTDGRWRPIEPGTFPLVDGSTFRMGQRAGRLRAYGNAIVPQVAAVFIQAACEAAGIRLDVDAGP